MQLDTNSNGSGETVKKAKTGLVVVKPLGWSLSVYQLYQLFSIRHAVTQWPADSRGLAVQWICGGGVIVMTGSRCSNFISALVLILIISIYCVFPLKKFKAVKNTFLLLNLGGRGNMADRMAKGQRARWKNKISRLKIERGKSKAGTNRIRGGGFLKLATHQACCQHTARPPTADPHQHITEVCVAPGWALRGDAPVSPGRNSG